MMEDGSGRPWHVRWNGDIEKSIEILHASLFHSHTLRPGHVPLPPSSIYPSHHFSLSSLSPVTPFFFFPFFLLPSPRLLLLYPLGPSVKPKEPSALGGANPPFSPSSTSFAFSHLTSPIIYHQSYFIKLLDFPITFRLKNNFLSR